MDPVPKLPSAQKTSPDPRAAGASPQAQASGRLGARTVTRADDPGVETGALQQPAPGKAGRGRKKPVRGTEPSSADALAAKALKKQQTRDRLSSKKGAQAAPAAMSRESMEREVISQVSREIANDSFKVPPATRAALTDRAQGHLVQLAKQHPRLLPMLEAASAAGLTIAGSGPGDVSLHLGPMSYPVDLGEDSGRQISSLEALCSGYPGGQVMLGWCVGNRQQLNPGLLLGALAEHGRVLEESWTDNKVRLTVHTAEYQSQWNTGIVGKHFTGLRRDAGSDRDVLGEKQLFDESRRRFLDGRRYAAQVSLYLRDKSAKTAPAAASPEVPQSTPAPAGKQVVLPSAAPIFDALITEGGGQAFSNGVSVEKAQHIAAASRQMQEIVEKLRYGGEDACVAFRQALVDRQLLLMRYARQKLLKKKVGNERSLLQQNEKALVDLAKRAVAGDGPARQRRAELVLHSMDVLEQIAVAAIDPQQFTKSELRSGDAAMASLFPQLPQNEILARDAAGFCRRLFDAIIDERSTAYMAAQEYEFTEASRYKPILYIYPSEPGPFIAEEAQGLLSTLVGHAHNQSGERLQGVVASLREQLAA